MFPFLDMFRAKGTPSYPKFPDKKANRLVFQMGDRIADTQHHMMNILNFAPQQMSTPASADFNRIDLDQAAQVAINFNEKNMPWFMETASRFNKAAVADRMDAIRTMAPEWEKIRGEQAATISSFIRGQVGAGTQAEVARSAAFSAIQGGIGGSKAGAGISARDLGLSSAGLSATGLQAANQWSSALAELMPEQITGNDVMRNSGMTTETAVRGAFQNEQMRQQVQQFNITNRMNVDQFNTNTVNQFRQWQAGAQLNVLDKGLDRHMQLTSARLGILDALHNSMVGQMGQKEKAHAQRWSWADNLQGIANSALGVGMGAFGGSMFGGGSGGGGF